MKDFRKDEKDYFICEECGKTYKSIQQLSVHINKEHNGKDEYFVKWLKDEFDGKCKICGNEVKLTDRLYPYYKNCCCKECSNIYNYKQTEKACLKLYGIENVNKLEKFKEKGKQTKKERYGSENYNNQEKNKETCLKRYRVENVFQSEEKKIKIKQSTKIKYGTENNMQSEKGKEEFKESMLKNHGIEWPMQSREIHEKQQKSALLLKHFRDTNLWYRGSYELDFLEKYYTIFSDMINNKTIKYLFEEKLHYYFPDFFIPSLNLIVEIKNSHLLELQKNKIIAKEKATKEQGYNYILIVDKDYTKFQSFLVNHGTSNL